MHVVFVATELSPWVPGGAGSVIARLRDRLGDRGDRVTVVLVADALDDVPGDVVVAGSAPTAQARSVLAAATLRRVVEGDEPDLIEFQDFDGLAFEALARRPEYALARIPIQVRFHAPFDLVFESIGVAPDWLPAVRSMERSSLAMSDRVVVPTEPMAGLVVERYGVEPGRIAIGQAPIVPRRPLERTPAPTPVLIALGRLGEQKGSHDLAAGIAPLLRSRPDLRIVFIGEDGWSAAANRPMREWLTQELIPSEVADRVEFAGRLTGAALDRRLAEAWAAVFPSRFETFSLAAHEARQAGLPVVVSDLPAFRGLLDESTGALVYDGSVEGLVDALGTIVDDGELRSRLASAPLPEYGDPLEPYQTGVAVRHPRSQAGLATAAVQQLEQVETVAATGADHGRLQQWMRWIPGPVARAAVRLVPQFLKDRFRSLADWRVEQDRRTRAARRTAIAERIAAGGFPELSSPLISIVIPCYNQGQYLDDAIRSVFEQTIDSFEVIVVDDGSNDPDTVAGIDALTWPRTTVIRQENAGLPGARNTGIARARGRYVVPLDADDELEPEFLERLVAALEADAEAAFACCWATLFGDVAAVAVPRPYNEYQLLLSNSVIGCVVLRRDAWEAVGGYDETMRHGNEDWELWVRLTAAGWGVAEVDAPLFRYRKHGVSMSVETEARFEHARKEILDRHRDLYEPAGLASRKAEHYPLLTVIVPPEAELPSLETPEAQVVQGTLDTAIDAANGKYVVHWSGVDSVEPRLLLRMADLLEDADDVGAVSTNSATPLVVVRRWSLHDPGAPQRVEVLDVPGTATAQLSPGSLPDQGWIVPTTIDGLPVQRQRPEEEGRLPAWVGA